MLIVVNRANLSGYRRHLLQEQRSLLPIVLPVKNRQRRHPSTALDQIEQPGSRTHRRLDVAQLAAWLCSPDARWVNGQAIVVDGGLIVGSGSRAMASLAAEGSAEFAADGVDTPGGPAAAARRGDS